MRVLQLNIQYTGTGADRCARELFRELPKLGVESSIWTGRPSAVDPPELRILPYKWERALLPLEAFPDLTDWRHRGTIDALRKMSTAEFDLVHIHNIHSGWISIKAVRELTERAPCVWTLHDEWAPRFGLTYDLTGKISAQEVKRLSRGLIRYVPYHRYHENFKWRRTRPFLRRWMPQPKAVICPSSYMKSLAEGSGAFPSAEIIHVPNGTTLPRERNSTMDRAEAKRSFGISEQAPTVLMISADLAQAHKGIDLGLKAIKAAASSRGLHVVLLGGSSERIAEAVSPLRVSAVSARDSATLARAYRAADLTIIPSLGENFPYVALESLACGTPCIAFPVGGTPEIIGGDERGVVCSEIDPVEMSQHIAALVSNPKLRDEMGNRGMEWVRKVCDMSTYVATIASLYEETIGKFSSS